MSEVPFLQHQNEFPRVWNESEEHSTDATENCRVVRMRPASPSRSVRMRPASASPSVRMRPAAASRFVKPPDHPKDDSAVVVDGYKSSERAREYSKVHHAERNRKIHAGADEAVATRSAQAKAKAHVKHLFGW